MIETTSTSIRVIFYKRLQHYIWRQILWKKISAIKLSGESENLMVLKSFYLIWCFITGKPWDWESQYSDRSHRSRYVIIQFSCNFASDKSLLADWTRHCLDLRSFCPYIIFSWCPVVSFVERVFPNKHCIIMIIKPFYCKSVNVSKCEVAFWIVYHHHLVVYHWILLHILFSFSSVKKQECNAVCSLYCIYNTFIKIKLLN